MKYFNAIKIAHVDKNYREHRGVLVKKYRSLLGKYVFVIEENNIKSKVYVGRMLFENVEIGSPLTVGVINSKLVNIRPGICENIDA